MRDMRTGDGIWVKDAEINVEGDESVGPERPQWRSMAVLEVHPRDVPFLVGWHGELGSAEFFSEPVETLEAKFAMGLGDKPVWFIVRAVDGRTQLVIELVEIVDLGDERYETLPRY